MKLKIRNKKVTETCARKPCIWSAGMNGGIKLDTYIRGITAGEKSPATRKA